jgi:stearoyl-CoA desaturase (delta-9 desaturase)
MRVVYEFSQRLQSLWTEKAMSYDTLTKALRDWCEQAEATGIEALREFAREIRMYTTAPAMA